MEALDHVFQVMGLREEAIEYLKNVEGCSRVTHILYDEDELQQLVQESKGHVKRGDVQSLRIFISWAAIQQKKAIKAPPDWMTHFTCQTFDQFEWMLIRRGEGRPSKRPRLASIIDQVLGLNKQQPCDWLDHVFSFCEAKELARARSISRGFRDRVDSMAKREVRRLLRNDIKPVYKQSWTAMLHGVQNLKPVSIQKIRTWDGSLRKEGFDIGILTTPLISSLFGKVATYEAIVLFPLTGYEVCVPVLLQFDRMLFGDEEIHTGAKVPASFLHPNAYSCGAFSVCSRRDIYKDEKTLMETLRRLQFELSNPEMNLDCPHNQIGQMLIHGRVGSQTLFDKYFRMSLEILREYILGKPFPSLQSAQVAAEHKLELLRSSHSLASSDSDEGSDSDEHSV